MSKWIRKGNAEFVGMAYACVCIVIVFIYMTAFITYSRSLNNITNALTVVARTAAIAEEEKFAKSKSARVLESAITDPNIRSAKVIIKPVGKAWKWKAGNIIDVIVEADVDTITPYVIGGKVRKLQTVTIEGNLELDFEHMKNRPYDPYTPRSAGEVRQMIAFAKFWLDKGLTYGSVWDGNDPDFKRSLPLSRGGISDCSWFLFHVLEKFGYVDHFVHSYEWGNAPETYPGAINMGSDVSKASPGDIICTGAGIWSDNSHVAMYIGHNQVIEMCPGGLTISPCPSSPREIVHYVCNPFDPG